MHFKLVIAAIMIIALLPLQAEKTKVVNEKQLLEQNLHKLGLWQTQYGFDGSVTPINDGRLFFKMRGTFPLPEPVDTLIFKANCQIISNYVRELYKEQKKKPVIHPYPGSKIEVYNSPGSMVEKNYSTTYYQYYNGFRLVFYRNPISIEILPEERFEGTLDIRYSITNKQYIITNRLYMEKIPMPKPHISQKQALEIVRHETQIYWSQNKDGIRDPGPGTLSAPVLGSYYLSVYSNGDYTTSNYSFKYVYDIQIVILGNPQVFLVDGMTGKMSKPAIID